MNARSHSSLVGAIGFCCAVFTVECTLGGENPLLFPLEKDGKYGYINAKGKFVIEPRFEYAAQFSEGLAAVGMNGKRCYINQYGKIVIETQPGLGGFDFHDGMAQVGTYKKFGFIDKRGDLVIDLKYEEVRGFSEGFAAFRVSDSNKWGFINKTGKVVIEPRFETAYWIGSFHEGLAPVCAEWKSIDDNKWGYIDRTGKFVIPPQFVSMYPLPRFSEGLACAKNSKGKWGFMDKTGIWVIEPQFDKAGGFSEGLAWVVVGSIYHPQMADAAAWEAAWRGGGKYGFVDRKGNWVIAPQFEAVGSFSEGLAAAWGEGGWGYINRRGKFVIKPQFPDVYSGGSFLNGLARGQLEKREGIHFTGGWVTASGGRSGYINKRGEVIATQKGVIH